MIYDVRHVTRVSYAAPVSQAQFNIRLTPWGWPGQSLQRFSLQFSPQPDTLVEKTGPYCVNATLVSFAGTLQELEISSMFAVDVQPFLPSGEGPELTEARQQALASRDISVVGPAPYIFASRIADSDYTIAQWAMRFFEPDKPVLSCARDLMGAIYHDLAYQPGATSSATPPAEAFAKRQGVCQDFAHIMIVGLRSQGVPASYVSGYLRTVPPPGQARLVGADAMHAWVNVWCGRQLGWIGFDPTNNCLAGGDHILLAMGRDYADVAPIDGRFVGSAPQSMETSVDVVEVPAL